MKTQLLELQAALIANANADWSENDPSQEFEALANQAGELVKQLRVHNLSQFLSGNEYVADVLTLLEAQAEIDDSVEVEDLDVTFVSAFEYNGLTVRQMLDMI